MIKEDKSYLSQMDLLAIEKEIAQLDIHSLKLSIHKDKARFIEELLDKLAAKYLIYQYKDKGISYSRDDWDLFFWCNALRDSQNNYCEGRDYSYVTLNPNTKRSIEQRLADIKHVLDDIQAFGIDGIEVYIQYTTKYDDNKVQFIALGYLAQKLNTTINMWGHEGKIKPVSEGQFGFFKKGAKTKYYQLSYRDIMSLALAQ